MKRFLLITTLVGLISCIGIDSQISMRNDGSGTLRLSYKISQFMKNLDTAKENRTLPLPISREDFTRTVEGSEGLKLVSLRQNEDEQNVYIDALIEFSRVEAVNAIGREGQISLTYAAEGDTHTFRQVIYRGRELEEISQDSLKMLDTFFTGYELSYAFTAPAPIKKYSLGILSQDKRSVSYTTSVSDLFRKNERTVLEVVW